MGDNTTGVYDQASRRPFIVIPDTFSIDLFDKNFEMRWSIQSAFLFLDLYVYEISLCCDSQYMSSVRGDPVKTGKVIKNFSARDGRKVILRTPKWEDLDSLTEHINALVEENVDMTYRKVTRENEADRLGNQLVEMEKGNKFVLVAEVDGKIVATSSITRGDGYSKHVGRIAMGIRNGYRDVGIGTEMLKTLIAQAEQMSLKVLFLMVFSTNKRAMHVYEKVGFKETGCIPNEICKNGKFVDHVIMAKQLIENA